MPIDSLAPIRRAVVFFSFMGAAVAALTLGAGLQAPADQSSATVARAKLERQEPVSERFAAVDPAQRQATPVKRAIPSAQQALVVADRPEPLRR